VDEQRYARMFRISPVAQALANEDGLLVEVNPAYCALVGRSESDLIGQSARIHTHPDDFMLHSSVEDLMAAGRAADSSVGIEVRFLLPDGNVKWVLLSLVPFPGPDGAEWNMAVAVDVTSRKMVEEGVFHASRTDQLTGALNRRGWADHAVAAFETDTAGATVVAVLDLDHFKMFNDRFGHAAGDSVLVEFTAVAMECIESGDALARWGGEEFVLTLHHCDRAKAQHILESISARTPSGLTFSAGYTTRRIGEGLRSTLERADALMFQAKRSGRNRMLTDPA
jgi:diguanylate cyclase (GGDEF)-like protein/PAS domain S-box-containing protein